MKLLKGLPVAKKIQEEDIIANIDRMKSDRPHLAIILVGDNRQGEVYVREKEKTGRNLGIDVLVYKFPNDCQVSQIKETIKSLNVDSKVSGIIVQLPLPKFSKAGTEMLLNLINPAKDVDLLSSLSSGLSLPSLASFIELKSRYLANHRFLPPTAAAVLEIIDFYQIPLEDVVIIGRGVLVGAPIVKLLNELDVDYQIIHSQTRDNDRQEILKKARLVITGSSSVKPIIKAHNLRSDAFVIDCARDFDHNSVSKNFYGSITPPIGGIGPVTVACLLRNVVYAKLWTMKFNS